MADQNILKENVHEAAYRLKVHLKGRQPEIGIILGSGLGVLADRLEDALSISFNDIPHMRPTTNAWHKGAFVCGTLAGKCVLIMQGRLHGYEGYSAQEIAFPVWLMHELGIGTLITTNAAGAINSSYREGDFCVITDHINFTGRNPIVGQDALGFGDRFFSMADAYDPALVEIALKSADQVGVVAHRGVFLGLLGPSFETPAEIRAFKMWGADTVAMSLCDEVIAARHVGMRVLGISLCTNMACGIESASPNKEEVFDVAKRCEGQFCSLIATILSQI